jgi:tryptophan-rich sensory protein
MNTAIKDINGYKDVQWLKLIISLILPLAAGYIASAFTAQSITGWYYLLQKPSFNPPNWLFAPVWTTLYIMMGISLYLVWKQSYKRNISFELNLFLFQLVLNILWTIIFFGLNEIFIAFLEILLLWVSIIICIIYFYRINKTAAYLMVPYIFWVSFASILTFSIWKLN